MNEKHFLEEAVYEYIKNNQHKNIDSVDICCYFKLSADITMKAVSNLENRGRVKRENYFGFNYRYVII